MMRGTANEDVLIEFVRNLKVVREIHKVVLLALRGSTHFTCSPGGIAIVEVNVTKSVSLEGQATYSMTESRGVLPLWRLRRKYLQSR